MAPIYGANGADAAASGWSSSSSSPKTWHDPTSGETHPPRAYSHPHGLSSGGVAGLVVSLLLILALAAMLARLWIAHRRLRSEFRRASFSVSSVQCASEASHWHTNRARAPRNSFLKPFTLQRLRALSKSSTFAPLRGSSLDQSSLKSPRSFSDSSRYSFSPQQHTLQQIHTASSIPDSWLLADERLPVGAMSVHRLSRGEARAPSVVSSIYAASPRLFMTASRQASNSSRTSAAVTNSQALVAVEHYGHNSRRASLQHSETCFEPQVWANVVSSPANAHLPNGIIVRAPTSHQRHLPLVDEATASPLHRLHPNAISPRQATASTMTPVSSSRMMGMMQSPIQSLAADAPDWHHLSTPPDSVGLRLAALPSSSASSLHRHAPWMMLRQASEAASCVSLPRTVSRAESVFAPDINPFFEVMPRSSTDESQQMEHLRASTCVDVDARMSATSALQLDLRASGPRAERCLSIATPPATPPEVPDLLPSSQASRMHSVAVRRPTLIHRASTSSLSTDPSHSKEDGFSAPQTPNMPCGPPLGNSSTAASPVSAESHTVRQFKEAFHLDLGGKGSPVPLSLMPSPLIERSNPFSHAFGMSVKAAASPYAPSLSPPTNRSHAEARKQSRFASGWL